jgi:4-amino-4-deoxy-L-arabinose transferase-like glycosyltransferase
MKTKILLIIIFFVAFFVRFYGLGTIPDGLSQDESSIGFNAYSILQTGEDEYGKAFPLSFKAFGEYKLPGYVYLTIPSISYFGTTPLGVRFPSAIFGFLTVVVFYFFVKKLTNKTRIAVLATFLLALNPWHIHFSRAAFEVTPALFFIVVGSYLFLQFVGTKKYHEPDFGLGAPSCIDPRAIAPLSQTGGRSPHRAFSRRPYTGGGRQELARVLGQ